MNPIILPSAIGLIVRQIGLFNLGMATGLGEAKIFVVVILHLFYVIVKICLVFVVELSMK